MVFQLSLRELRLHYACQAWYEDLSKNQCNIDPYTGCRGYKQSILPFYRCFHVCLDNSGTKKPSISERLYFTVARGGIEPPTS